MTKYEVKCVDADGDELKIEIAENGLTNASIDAEKFSMSLNATKIARLIDSIHALQNLLTDFQFKKLEIEVKE